MRIEKQLSIFMENRPGLLAKICSVLSEASVNILALSVHDTVDHAVVRLVVDNSLKALLLLEREELYILEQPVVLVEIENEPGVLARISQKLARADINISYAYCTATDRQSHGCLILKTDDPERTLEIVGRPEGALPEDD